MKKKRFNTKQLLVILKTYLKIEIKEVLISKIKYIYFLKNNKKKNATFDALMLLAVHLK